MTTGATILGKKDSSRWEVYEQSLSKEEIAELKSVALSAKAKSTVQNYQRGFRRFREWAEKRNKSFMPAKPEIVALYLCTLVKRNLSFSSILTAFCSISWQHTFEGFRDLTVDCICKSILESAKRTCKSHSGKKPLKPVQLNCIIELLSRLNTVQAIRDKCWILVAYSCCLRNSELRNLKIGDVKLSHKNELSAISIRRSKTDIYGAGNIMPLQFSGKITCPLSAVRQLLSILCAGSVNGHENEPLFQTLCKHKDGKLWFSGKPLSYSTYRTLFKSYLKQVGISPEKLSLHSLRKGSATLAAQSGVPNDLVKVYGRWSTEASKDRYVNYSLKQKVSVVKTLNL